MNNAGADLILYTYCLSEAGEAFHFPVKEILCDKPAPYELSVYSNNEP